MTGKNNNYLFKDRRETALPCGNQQCPICPTPSLADVPAIHVTRIESQPRRKRKPAIVQRDPEAAINHLPRDPNGPGAWESAKYERRADSETCDRLTPVWGQ